MKHAKFLTLIFFTIFLMSCSDSNESNSSLLIKTDSQNIALENKTTDKDNILKNVDKKDQSPSNVNTKAAADTKAKADADAKTKSEADAKTKADADAKTKSEADAKTKAEADTKTKAEADAKTQTLIKVTKNMTTPIDKSNPSPAKNSGTITSERDLLQNIANEIKIASNNGTLDKLDVNILCADAPISSKDMCTQKANKDIQNAKILNQSMQAKSHDQKSKMKVDINDENPCAKVPKEAKAECEKEIADTRKENEASKAKAAAEDQAEAGKYVKNFDPTNISKIARFNFTELNNFSRMSKLRSGVGHDYSSWTSEHDPSGMNCKSMKHYFIPKGVPRQNSLYATTPHSFEWMSTKFFAPMDGTITAVNYTDTPDGREAQFSILSSEYPGYYISFLHIRLLPGLVKGSSVTAGQQIGTLGNEQAWGEIVAEVHFSRDSKALISFLQVATDEVLQLYKDRGVTSAEDVIITKEERDANPLACERKTAAGWFKGSSNYQENIQFSIWVFESEDNWFFFKN